MNFVALRGGRLADGLAEDAEVTLRLQRLPFKARLKTLRKKSVPMGLAAEEKNARVYLGLKRLSFVLQCHSYH